jgi:hypothetical protein
MKLKLLTATLISFFFFSSQAQEKIYMPYLEVMNIHPDYQYSTSKLFKTYIDNYKKYELILPDKYDTLGFDESFDQVKQKAIEKNCTYFIIGELNRLGDVVVITINLYNASDGKKIWQSIKKAYTPDDIDPIMEKLAVNLGKQNQSEGEDIYSVTDYDSRELNKIGANKYFGVSIGGGGAFVSGISKNLPAGFGAVGSYDMRNMIFNIRAEMFFSDIKLYYFDINALYPFNSGKNSPFVLGGMGYGGCTMKSTKDYNIYNYEYNYNSGSGLYLFGGGGYLFNRNAEVSLRFGGNFYFPLFKVDGKIPAGILFTTTLLFGR